jgi:ethanolamine ammonia-lyase large subunit
MVDDESIEDLVDRVINKSDKFEIDKSNIKEGAVSSFRYVTDEEEIKSVLTPEGVSPVAKIMGLPDEVKTVDGVSVLSGLGDTSAIESVIQKHIQLKNLKDK